MKWMCAILSAACFAAGAAEKYGEDSIEIGDKVPSFELTALDGAKIPLESLLKDKDGQARPAVLMYWCSSCSSCRIHEFKFAEFARKYAGKASVFALGANADESAQSVRLFLKNRELDLPVLLDPNGASCKAFGARLTLTTVVIAADGTLRFRGVFHTHSEAFAENALTAILAGEEVKTSQTGEAGCPIRR